ncbi:hypothetical protein FDUTEX481_05576 [Tolypothrix sp. PCC 7601]|nr:hypothetical protein FDUTEX481_05576 [Tolypothrix sp. PCC 7601]
MHPHPLTPSPAGEGELNLLLPSPCGRGAGGEGETLHKSGFHVKLTPMSNAVPYCVRDFQEINYSILWGGHLARHINWADKMSTPQYILGYFFIWMSLMQAIVLLAIF